MYLMTVNVVILKTHARSHEIAEKKKFSYQTRHMHLRSTVGETILRTTGVLAQTSYLLG